MTPSLTTHAALVEEAEQAPEGATAAGLSPEEDVGGDVERRRNRKILIHRFDPGALRIARRTEVDAFATE